MPGVATSDDGYLVGTTANTAVLQPTAATAANTTDTLLSVMQQSGWEQDQTLVRFAGVQSIPDNATLVSAQLTLFSPPSTTTVAAANALNVVAQWVSPSLWPITTAAWSSTMTPDAHTGTPLSQWANASTTNQKQVNIALINVTETNIPYRAAGTNYAALRLWLDITGKDSATVTSQRLAWGAWDSTTVNGPQLQITWAGPPNTADRIYYTDSNLKGYSRQLFRFKNGTLLLMAGGTDPQGPGYFTRTTNGVWTRNAYGDRGMGGFTPFMGIAASPTRTDDGAYMLYNTSTGVRLCRVTGNPDGTLTFGAAVTVTTTTSGGQGLDLLVDKNGYVHVFHVVAGASSGWTHRVYDSTLGTNIRETVNVGSPNDPFADTIRFYYDQVNHRIVMLYTMSTFLDARECTLGTTITAGSGVTWKTTVSITGLQSTSTPGTAQFGPDGVLQIIRTGSQWCTWYQFGTTGFVNKGNVGSATVPYTYFVTTPIIRVTADGQIWVFGRVYKGNGPNVYKLGSVRWDGGVAAWSDPVFLTAGPEPTYSGPVLTTVDSDKPDDTVWMGAMGVGSPQANNVAEGHSGLWQPIPPGYSNVAGDSRRWLAGLWHRDGNRFGSLSPF